MNPQRVDFRDGNGPVAAVPYLTTSANLKRIADFQSEIQRLLGDGLELRSVREFDYRSISSGQGPTSTHLVVFNHSSAPPAWVAFAVGEDGIVAVMIAGPSERPISDNWGTRTIYERTD
jgi:hypothetical protein